MAAFNPEVKDVKPVNPIGWSKSADVPSQFASGLSEAIKGIGNTIQLGAKAGVDLVEENINKTTRDTIEPIRDDNIARLAGEDFKLKLGVTDTPTDKESNASITQGNTEDLAVPGDLKRELKGLSILPDARANGKISETGYYGRLMSAASDLRSRYPVGFRDYIDKEISKITGVDPANAYMQSLVGDINAAHTNAQALRNRALGVVQDVIGLDPNVAPEVWRRVSSGQWTPDQGIAYAAPFLAIKAKHDVTMQQVAEQKATQEATKTSVLNSFSKMAASTAYEQLNSTFKINGIDNNERLSEVIENHRAGRVTLTTDQAYQYGDKALAMKQAYVSTMQKALYADPRVYGILQKEGLDAIDQNAKIFDHMADNFYNKDVGAALSTKRKMEGIQNDIALRVWTQDPKASAILGMTKVIRDAGGDTMVSRWEQRLVAGGADEVMDTYIKKVTSDLATPDRPTVAVKEVKNLDEAIAKGVAAQKIYNKPLPTYFRAIQEMVHGDKFSLLDPETPKSMKDEIGFRLFNQFNVGALRQIQIDKRDPKTGEMLPGQESWFKAWTSPEVVQAVNQNLRPEVRQMYYDWVKLTNEDVFGRAIRDLGSMNIEGAYTVSWNNTSNPPRLEVKTSRTDNPTDAYRGDVRRALRSNPLQDTVERVNKSIEGLSNVFRGQNLAMEDVEAKIFQSLSFQLDPKNRAAPAINNIPEKFVQGLRLNYEKMKAEEEEKAAKKAAMDAKYK